MNEVEHHALDAINRVVLGIVPRSRTCYLWVCPESYCGHQETAPGKTLFCPECGCEMNNPAAPTT